MFKDRSKKSKFGANGAKLGHFAYCECCDWYASKKYNWERHLLTKTHQKKAFKSVQNPFKNVQKGCKVVHDRLKKAVKKTYVCEYCNKEYKNRNGLWYHKKKCEYRNGSEEEEEESEEDTKDSPEDGVYLTKEQFNMLLNHKTMGNNNTNCNNTTTNNITVQVYLDNHCKDAKTIEEISKKIMNGIQSKLKLNDIVYTSNSQLIKDAPSELFIKEINKMSAEERPVHCADSKRGKFWVNKQEDGWVKEDVNEEGGALKQRIKDFKFGVWAKGHTEIVEKVTNEDRDYSAKEIEIKNKIHHEILEKNIVENNIIAKLATQCNIKDAIKDIENVN